MKKLLLLLVGVVVAFAVHADEWSGRYVAFQSNGTGWDTKAEVTSQDYGKCEWKGIKIGTSGFRIKSWDDSAKKNTYYGGDITVTPGNGWSTLTDCGENSSCQVAKVKDATADKTYDVTFYQNSGSINIVEVGGGSTSSDTYHWCINGKILGSSDWEKTRLVKNEETGNWEYSSDKFVSGAFGMRKCKDSDDTQLDYIKGHNITEADKWFAKGSTNDSNLGFSGKYKFIFRESDGAIMMESEKKDPVYKLVYVNCNSNAEVVLNADNGFKDEFTFAGTETDAKVYVKKDDTSYGPASAQTYNGSTTNVDYTLTANSNKIAMAQYLTGKVTFTFDAATETLTLNGAEVVKQENQYTYYFYKTDNEEYDNPYIYVHDGSNNTGIKPMISTGMYVKVNGEDKPVWYYTTDKITWTPTKLIFLKGNGWGTNDSNKFSSNEPAAVNNGFYTYNSTAKENYTTADLVDLVFVEKPFYLIGKFNGWNQKEYKLSTTDNVTYTYNAESEIKSNPGGDGDAGWKINEGNWDDLVFGKNENPVLNKAFKVSSDHNAGNIDIDIPKGAVVTFTYDAANPNNSTILIKTEGSDDPVVTPTEKKYVYMQFKYDFENKSSSAEPYAYFYGEQKKENCNMPYGDSGIKMTHWVEKYTDAKGRTTDVDLTTKYSIWRAEVPADFTGDGVVFYFHSNASVTGDAIYYDSKWSHSSGESANGQMKGAKNQVTFCDYANWDKYIYATATWADTDNEFALQSYITPAEFLRIDRACYKNGARENLYVIGWERAKYKELDANGQPTGEWKDLSTSMSSLTPVNYDNGCFYLPIKGEKYTEDNQTKWAHLKITWINVGDYMPSENSQSKREWATFDLGLVGVDQYAKDLSNNTIVKKLDDFNYVDDSNNTNYKNGYNQYFSASGNGRLYMVQNNSVPYMNYNQADWYLPNNASNQNQWLVIDTHDGCHTATVTSFNPMPSLAVNLGGSGVQQLTLTDEQAKKLYHNANSEHLSVAETSGHVYFNTVNYATGEVTLSGMDDSQLTNHTVVYKMSVAGDELPNEMNKLGVYKADYLAINANSEITARGKFTDKSTGLHFHSRTAKATVETTAKMNTPGEGSYQGRYLHNGTGYGVFADAVKMAVADEDGNNLFWIPDFVSGDAPLELIHRAHPISVIDNGVTGFYDKYDGDEFDGFNQDNNWAKCHNEDTFNGVGVKVYLPLNVSKADAANYNISYIAQYPFLNSETSFTWLREAGGGNAPAMVSARATANPEGQVLADLNAGNLSVTYVPRTANATIEVKNPVVSGIEEVAAEGCDAAAEYYTISGVKVQGQPAAGIYLMRQGDKVSKVVIR